MFRSRKEGKKPLVVRANPFSAVKNLLDRGIIKIHGGRSGQRPEAGSFAMDDVFMMTHSLAQKGSGDIPIRATSNHLSQRGYNILYKSSDETSGHEKDESDGKIVFSTFHASKGSERGLVVCFGADESWFRYYGDGEPRDFPPNIWTVAMTRCTEQLVLIQNPKEEPLPFIAWDQCGDCFEYIDLTGDSVPRPMKGLPPMKDQPIAVTKLLSHQPWEELDAAMAHVIVTELPSDDPMPDHPLKIEGRFGTVEDVSDILGRAVGLYLEYTRTQSLKWISGAGKGNPGQDAHLSQSVVKPLMELVALVEQGAAKLSDIENLAMYVHAVDELLVHRVKQLPETLDVLSKHENALESILGRLPPMTQYEREVEVSTCGRTVVGVCDSVMDVLAPTELKYTSVLSSEHILQAACYHYMMSPCPPTLLANVRTGQRLRVEARPSFGQALACLVANKTRKKSGDTTEEEFLRVADMAAEKWKPGSEAKQAELQKEKKKKRGTKVKDDGKQRTLLCWLGKDVSSTTAIACP